MKLFVDDERPAPEGWVWAKTSEYAINMLERWRDSELGRYREDAEIEVVSLDHDLGGDDTARRVVLWMCEHEQWPSEVYVHTGNPIGEEWLVGMVRRYAPPGTLKGYGLNYWGTGPDSVLRTRETP